MNKNLGQPTFESALEHLINQYSQENDSDTPDFILAAYLQKCLDAYNVTIKARDAWFSVDMWSENKRSAVFNDKAKCEGQQ